MGGDGISRDGPWATSTSSFFAGRSLRSYERQLADRVLFGGVNAAEAAMVLLENCQPETLDDAVALLTRHGQLTVEAFDRVADAWGVFRHIGHLSWD